jgi:GAF domain-containing protein
MVEVVEPPQRDGDAADSAGLLITAELADLTAGGWSCLEQLSRALRVDEADLQATLDAIARTATATIPVADAAGINLFEKGKFLPQAVFGEAPPVLDKLQQQTGKGPCVDASRDQQVIDIADMESADRWKRFARRAVGLNVWSMLCLPLWTNDRTLGSLSLYAGRPNAFDDASRSAAGLFATLAALALGDAQRTDRLRKAMTNRDTIGQAKGILMERHRVTADRAFDMLIAASKHYNRKVIDIAQELAETGHLSNP